MVLDIKEPSQIIAPLLREIESLPEDKKDELFERGANYPYKIAAALGKVEYLTELMDKCPIKNLQQISEITNALGYMGKKAQKALPILFQMAERKINEWEGGKEYLNQYEDVITEYYFYITDAIKSILESSFPEDCDKTQSWTPNIFPERDPRRTTYENMYSIRNIDALRRIARMG